VNLNGWQFADRKQSERIYREHHGKAWEILQYMVQSVEATDSLRFACQRCGHCCSRRPLYGERLSGEEATILNLHCLRHEIEMPVEWRPGQFRVPVMEDNSCAWMARRHGTAKCLVYEVRPMMCRITPIGALMDPKEKLIALAVRPKQRPRTYDVRECLGMEFGGPRTTVEKWLEYNEWRVPEEGR
jgi:Fe-S-cluster containining protein